MNGLGYAPPGWIFEENLRRDGEDRITRKACQQGLQEVPIDDHVVVEQDDDFRIDNFNSAIVAADKTIIALQFENANSRKPLAHERNAPVRRTVIDDQDFVLGACSRNGCDH